VVVAPAPGTLTVVEEEGPVEEVVVLELEAPDPVVVVGPSAAWWAALEQLAAAMAKAIRATPGAARLPFRAARSGRRWAEMDGCERRR
jgi:hypothetical protein